VPPPAGSAPCYPAVFPAGSRGRRPGCPARWRAGFLWCRGGELSYSSLVLLTSVEVGAEAAPRARPGDGFDGPGDAVAAEQQACPSAQVPRLCLLATVRVFRAGGPAWCPGNVVAGE
jgi:hypothetical protein